MRRVLTATGAIVMALALAGCHLLPPPGAAPLRYRDELFGVALESDVVYAEVTTRQGAPVALAADVYRPADDTVTGRPAVIWVHGGFFSSGSKESPEIVDQAETFAAKGYVSVAISYRLSEIGCTLRDEECFLSIADAQADAQTAVRWLRANAETYGIDPDRIAIAGSSAGAITALNVGYSGDQPLPGPYGDQSSRVRAAVSLSGSAMPFDDIGPGDAPALLLHNQVDLLVPFEWAEFTVQLAQEAGLVVGLTVFPGVGHVPYGQHRVQILTETTNFLYWMMGLGDAPR